MMVVKEAENVMKASENRNNQELATSLNNQQTHEDKEEKQQEEIDTDLDDFEAEERRILNLKDFTEQLKKKIIEDLYFEFG